MSELESLKHITSTMFVARFPEDIDPGSALDPGNWSIIGNDSSPLPVDNVLPAYPPYSWRDFFVQTRKPTDQEYSLTVSGLTDPEGNPLDPFTHTWTPLQPPLEYPSDGIMNPSLDGLYYGSRAEIAIFRYPDWVTNVLGIDSDENEYPFTQDPNDSRYWSFDTGQLPGPDEGFKVQPVPAEGHEEDFTEGELGILTIPILPSPFPPWMGEVMLSNQTRPGASTFYPTDTIVPTAFVHADQIRGMKVMIARIPFDPSILLPYYPPGANDPNDPNYDPEAPPDGSGNPDWWSLPPRPDFPHYPWSPDAPPPWMPRPMSAVASPWEDQVMPAYPPDIGKDEMWQIELPSFKPIDHDLEPGSYDLIVEVYDHENKKSRCAIPFDVELPLALPGVGRISEGMFRSIKDGEYDGHFGTLKNGEIMLYTREDIIEDLKLYFQLHGEPQEEAFTQDSNLPGLWRLDARSLGLLEDLEAELEATFGGTPPQTSRMWFPVYEWPNLALPLVVFSDMEDMVPAVINPWEFYKVRVVTDGLKEGDSLNLYARHNDASGLERLTNLARFDAQPGWTPNEFNWVFEGAVLNSAFGGQGTTDRVLGAEVQRTGNEEPLVSEIDVDAQTSHKSFEEAVKDATQEYIDADLPYDMKEDGEPPLTGKGTPEEISQQPGLYGQGPDCSGMYFRVMDRALRESAIDPNGMRDIFKQSSRPENANTVGYWGGEDVRDNRIFKDVNPDDRDNPMIKDLRVGDAIDWDNPNGTGHVSYISEIEEVETNAHYEITVAQSAGRFDGPHDSTFDVPKNEYDAGKKLDKVDEEDWHGDAEEQESAHKSITDFNTSVRRLKKLDEYYSETEGT